MAHVSAVATVACVGVLATDVAGATGATGATGAAGWAYCKVNNRPKYKKTVGTNNAKTKYKILFHKYYTAHTCQFVLSNLN